MLLTNERVNISHWWDARARAQRVPTDAKDVHRHVRHDGNAWRQAMAYMSKLLDAMCVAPPPPPAPPPPMSPPPPSPPAASARWPRLTAWLQSAPVAESARAERIGAVRDRMAARRYAQPVHTPVLFSRDLVAEMESRWAGEFAATRAHRQRSGDDIELNFLYAHYARVTRRPVARGRGRHRFLYIQDCVKRAGAAECAHAIARGAGLDSVCLNDLASSQARATVTVRGAAAASEALSRHADTTTAALLPRPHRIGSTRRPSMCTPCFARALARSSAGRKSPTGQRRRATWSTRRTLCTGGTGRRMRVVTAAMCR